jgi:hypothetical protein
MDYFKPKIDLPKIDSKKLVAEVDWRREGTMSAIDNQLDCGK